LRPLPFALACGLVVAACGGQPPAVFVGESAHFRLYVDPALMSLPAAFAGDNALAALETHWSDVATMLAREDLRDNQVATRTSGCPWSPALRDR